MCTYIYESLNHGLMKIMEITSLCMLFEVVTIDLHYMTDRQERFDLKMLLQKQRHLHLGCP